MSPLPPIDYVAIRHPGQVRQQQTRAGIQKKFDFIEFSLDSGSRPAKRRSSGMTGWANCDVVSGGGDKVIGQPRRGDLVSINETIRSNRRRTEAT